MAGFGLTYRLFTRVSVIAAAIRQQLPKGVITGFIWFLIIKLKRVKAMLQKLYRDEIAFALEMISDGWQDRYIAAALSVKVKTLRNAIRKAKEHGAKENSQPKISKKRIRHTNKLAGSILAEKSRSQNLPRKKQASAKSNAG
jgi:hypothetical protein